MGEPGVKLLKVDDIYKIKSCRTKCGRNSNQMNSVFNVKLNYFPSHNRAIYTRKNKTRLT